jgi:hypothetical protein
MTDDEQEEYCPVCGGYMDWVECWNNCDDGEFDLYETDPLWYEPGATEKCGACDGKGGYLQCINIPHTLEQIETHKQKEAQA